MGSMAIEIIFLVICTGIALAPIAVKLDTQQDREVRLFKAIWVGWVVFWGGFAVLTATDVILFDPVILRLAALFGVQVAVGIGMFLAMPGLRRVLRTVPLAWLVGWQMARVVGGFFLVGAAFGQVSMPFAAIAGFGDMAVGVAAGIACMRMRADPDRSAQIALRHMRMGLIDFCIAVSTAILTKATIGWPYVLIPLFLVPMAVLAHLAVWDQLRQRSRGSVVAGTGLGG